MKIYLAAPLFNEMELERNKKMKHWLIERGYDVYLPQDESGLSYDMINEKNKTEINRKIFEEDVKGLKSCNLLIFVLDGRVPDEGGCIELGMAYAWGIPSIGFKTDTRALDKTGDDNLMIEGCINFRIARNYNQLEKFLRQLSL